MVRDLLHARRRPSGSFMDAIASLMFVEPAAMPSPRSETPLPDAPFDALVSASAISKEQDVDHSTDGPSDMAAPQAGLMAAIVSQWLAERDSAPSLPTFARGILEEHDSVVPEAAVSPDTAEEPALPLEGLPPTEVSEQAPEMVERAVAPAGINGAKPDHDPMESDSASPAEGSAPVAPRAQMEEPRVPIQQLMQHAADIGRAVPSSETRLASAEPKASAPSDPVEDAVAKLQAPTP